MSEPRALPPGLHVLVIDDDPKFRAFMEAGLRHNGAECKSTSDPEEAFELIRGAVGYAPDVVLLDVMMPEMSGWTFLDRILAIRPDVPVIFLTAREAVDERVRGLQMGADDYIIKPFAFAELLARIEVVIRRRQATCSRQGNLVLNSVDREALVDGRRIDLTPREFEVLRALVEAREKPQSRSQLLKTVWRTELDPETNVVEVHIARLRRKLDRAGGPQIVTVKGDGYTLAPDGPS